MLDLFEMGAALVGDEHRTHVSTVLLLIAFGLAAHYLALKTDLFQPHELEVAVLFAAQVAAGLALVSLLHVLRPLGWDLPPRSWSDSYERYIGPLCLTILGGLLAVACAYRYDPVDFAWMSYAGVVCGAAALLGLAMLVHAVRRPF